MNDPPRWWVGDDDDDNIVVVAAAAGAAPMLWADCGYVLEGISIGAEGIKLNWAIGRLLSLVSFSGCVAILLYRLVPLDEDDITRITRSQAHHSHNTERYTKHGKRETVQIHQVSISKEFLERNTQQLRTVTPQMRVRTCPNHQWRAATILRIDWHLPTLWQQHKQRRTMWTIKL